MGFTPIVTSLGSSRISTHPEFQSRTIVPSRLGETENSSGAPSAVYRDHTLSRGQYGRVNNSVHPCSPPVDPRDRLNVIPGSSSGSCRNRLPSRLVWHRPPFRCSGRRRPPRWSSRRVRASRPTAGRLQARSCRCHSPRLPPGPRRGSRTRFPRWRCQ